MHNQETISRVPRAISAGVLLAVVLAVTLLVKLPYLLAFERGVQAYLYGYPLVTTEMTKRVMTAPALSTTSVVRRRLGSAPLNQFGHSREFPDPTSIDVVAPNADTLYSLAWLDLKDEAMVLSMPDMHGRWVLVEVMDAWTNSFASLGTRLYGGNPRNYLITGPHWTGRVPDGVIQIKAPTNTVAIVGRTYTRNAADIAAVHALQAQYRLTPLSTFLNQSPVGPRPASATSSVDIATPVVTQVARLDADQFFSLLAKSMADNPPDAADGPMLKMLQRLGVEPGNAFAWDRLDAATRHGLEDAVWFVRGLFEARSPGTQGPTDTNGLQRTLFKWANDAIDKAMLSIENGWLVPLNVGRYGTHYALRAVVSLVGYGANVAQDAVYPVTVVDSGGDLLRGGDRYVLHFRRDQIPPASAFWSLTLYDERGFFVDNPINRYAIGDRDHLHFNQDGSLDLWIQHEQPVGEKANNWLPAPSGSFKLILRLYDPKPMVLNKQWVPPAVQKIR